MRVTLQGKGQRTNVQSDIGTFIEDMLPCRTKKDKGEDAYYYKREKDNQAATEYALNFIEGFITIEEFTYTVATNYVQDNLNFTSLMEFIKEHEEWFKFAQNPMEWHDYYIKDTHNRTGEITIIPATDQDMPAHEHSEYNYDAVEKQKTELDVLKDMLEEEKSIKRSMEDVKYQLQNTFKSP